MFVCFVALELIEFKALSRTAESMTDCESAMRITVTKARLLSSTCTQEPRLINTNRLKPGRDVVPALRARERR